MSAPTLLWLHIHQYEQFDAARIEFSSRENLLLGVNGAGKTRLLKLIRAVLSLDFSELLSRPFDVEFELRTVSAGDDNGDEVRVTARVTNVRGAAHSDAEDMSLQPPMELTATISYRIAERGDRCEVRGSEYSYYHDNQPVEIERGFLTRPGSLALRHRKSEKIYPRCHANYLSESDHEFRILSQVISFNAGLRRVTINPADEKGESLGAVAIWDLLPLVATVGMEYLDQLADGVDLATPGALRFPTAIDDAILPRLFAAMGARTVRLRPRIIREKDGEFECRGIKVSVEFLDGTKFPEPDELTFGQRRYLYAGIVFAPHPGVPVLVDELDNGLHPGLIATLLDLWKDRQLFLVSHNKLVIDHTNFAGPEDVQAKIHIVRRGEDGRQCVLALDEAAAQEVYEKIAVAIQSPSDVLRAEGLW